MKMCQHEKGKEKLSSTLSDKYTPFVRLKARGKVIHPNGCCRAPFFVSTPVEGSHFKKCRPSVRLLHVDAVKCFYNIELYKQDNKKTLHFYTLTELRKKV